MLEEATGYFTYRSFINEPKGSPNDILFGAGEMFLSPADDGTITGTLSFPAEPGTEQKAFMDLEGRVSSWEPLSLHFVGTGREGSAIADYEYEYDCRVAYEWDEPVNPPQVLSLVGTVRRNKDHGSAKAGVTASFIAVKREFVEPRQVVGAALIPEAVTMLASRAHRLRHTVWHTLRSMWFNPNMTDADRSKIRDLGWYLDDPPFRAIGGLDLSNGAGEDFLYMHRRMIKMLHKVYEDAQATPPTSWSAPPASSPQFVYKEETAPAAPTLKIYTYDAENSGEMVPPPTEKWLDQVGPGSRSFLKFNKKPRGLSIMQLMASRLRNPLLLSQMTLGAYGNYVEFTVHNWMHMRWATLSRNPETGEPEVRDSFDLDSKWDHPEYDYLGDFHSSHVNPLFWRLHGWVDDCIDAWFSAQEAIRPGVVKRKEVRGIDWFEKGDWVVKDDPFDWPGAGGHGDHGGDGHHDEEKEVKTLENVMALLKEVAEREAPEALAISPEMVPLPTLVKAMMNIELDAF